MVGMVDRVEGVMGEEREEVEVVEEARVAVGRLASLLRRCGSRVLTDQTVLSLTWPLYTQVGPGYSLHKYKFSQKNQAEPPQVARLPGEF